MRIEPAPPADALLPGYTRLGARITYDRRGLKPEQLWFDLPERLAEGLGQSGDGWLVALLPLALRLEEPIRLATPVDQGLRANITRLMEIWARWYPQYPAVEVEAPAAPARAPDRPGRTGLFFTGGVDSFYSALHFDATGGRIDDLIFVWGYDLPLSNCPAFEGKAGALAEVGERMGKEAIVLATNLRQTRLGSLDWPKVTHGAALGAAALMLGGRHSTVLLSAALARNDDESFGAHPLTDSLMSTSRTRFIHYGAEVCRFDKTAYIAGSDLVRQYLHVCWQDASDRNCGRCEKCWRTQLSLDLLGARDQASCFDPARYSMERAGRIRLGTPATVRLLGDLLAPAIAAGRLDIVEAIDQCIEANRRLDERYAGSRWRRNARKWRNSFRKRWLGGRRSIGYWAGTVAVVACATLQLADCWINPELVPWW